VTIFRSDDKTYFSESPAQFIDTGLISNIMVGQRSRYLSPSGYRRTSYMFCGVKAVRMTNTSDTVKFLPLQSAFNADPHIEAIIYAMNKMTTCGGIPLEVVGTSGRKDFFNSVARGGAREVFLETSKIVTVDVSPNQFAPPVGYKKAKSIREVVAGLESRVQSEDATELFDGGSKKSHK
jgi:hypothetical protein